jgi:hypothetical protein
MVKNEGRTLEKILHSKLSSNMWPKISIILEKIHFYLPRIPKVIISLYNENASDYNDNANFFDYKVKIKSTYTDTSS